MLLALLTALYPAALAWLLWVAHRKRAQYALAKGLCSALFLLCAALAWRAGARQQPAQFALLLGALVLCAFGDVLLGAANSGASHVSKKPFLGGAFSFCLAHSVLCALFYRRAPFTLWDLALPAALVAALWALERTDWVRMKKIRPLGYVYTFLVGLMAAKAGAAALVSPPLYPFGLCLSLGAGLFLASDVILLFLYFGTRRHKWYRPANLLSYYAGVYLLGLSALWF